MPIAVQLQPAAGETNTASPDQTVPRTVENEARAAVAAAVVNAPALPQVSKADVVPVRSANPVAVLAQPSDPTYYAVGDLDVFPKALVKPDLGAALSGSHVPSAGKVRATLLIDEAGVVTAVRGIEGAARDVEIVVRELLLHTRFTPARNKDGRIVKAQVLVALDYDTRAPATSR